MNVVNPQLVVRFGSHSEKDYVLKMAKFLDGFMVAANLIESTPGATGSLLIKLSGPKHRLPFYVDPMTYGFAQPLELLKSEQKRKKKVVVDFKKSYKRLSEQFGGVFQEVIENNKRLKLSELKKDSNLREIVATTSRYQLNRIITEFENDPELVGFAKDLAKPAAILTPYFLCRSSKISEWLNLIPRIAKSTVKLELGVPVHAVVCVEQELLSDTSAQHDLIEGLNESGCAGVWLWFIGLNEHVVSTQVLTRLRNFVEELSKNLEVHNMHGGFFSLALSKYGLSSTAHGVGYGEQKDIAPIQGQAMPTVRYYLPATGRRLGVPSIERAFNELDIHSAKDFHAKVCDCAICKGVVKHSLKEFSSFGDTRFASPKSRRASQTPAAAKRCRFHFMINRVKEVKRVRDSSLKAIINALRDADNSWGVQPSLNSDSSYLARWIAALSPTEPQDLEDVADAIVEERIAKELKLSIEEFAELVWEVEHDESDDGVLYGYILTVSEGPEQTLAKLGIEEGDWISLPSWIFDDGHPDEDWD